MSGKVIGLFEGRRNPRIGFEEFARRSQSVDLAKDVAHEFDEVIRKKNSVKVPGFSLREAQGPIDINFGLLQSNPNHPSVHRSDRSIIISNAYFPNYLMESGLDKSDALQLAASSVVAYCTTLKWITDLAPKNKIKISRQAIRPSALPARPELWHRGAYNPDLGQVDQGTITHRIAARIALNVATLKDFEPVGQPPFPMHIAALADALGNEQVRNIYQSTTAHI